MVRLAEPRDLESIRELIQSEPGLWDATWTDRSLAKALEAATGLAQVWEEDGRIVGFICAHDIGFRAYLSMLVVGASYRGRGIGRRLLRVVESEARARGCGILISDVWAGAAEFYRQQGWSEPEVLLLRKRLPPQGT